LSNSDLLGSIPQQNAAAEKQKGTTQKTINQCKYWYGCALDAIADLLTCHHRSDQPCLAIVVCALIYHFEDLDLVDPVHLHTGSHGYAEVSQEGLLSKGGSVLLSLAAAFSVAASPALAEVRLPPIDKG
jgi:hypothetical protein